jgi:hypothetical protein
MTISRNLSFLAEGVSSTGVLGATYGGTGQSSITTGDLLYGSASNTISKLAIGSTGTILRVVGGVPTWGTDYTGTVTSVAASVPSFLSISGSPITTSGTLAITYSGTALPIANGGTAQTSFTSGQVLYGSFSQSSNLTFNGTNLNVGGGAGTYALFLVIVPNSGTFQPAIYAGNATNADFQVRIQSNLTDIGTTTASPLTFSIANSEKLRLFSSGGVSIGNTTDPGSGNLSVTGGITASSYSSFNASGAQTIGISKSGGSSAYLGTTSNTDESLHIQNSSGSTTLLVNKNGSATFGITAGNSVLHTFYMPQNTQGVAFSAGAGNAYLYMNSSDSSLYIQDSGGNTSAVFKASGGGTTLNGPLTTAGYTVSTLPTGVTGARAYVTDALSLAFGVAVTGGGAVTIPVFYNGANWIVG